MDMDRRLQLKLICHYKINTCTILISEPKVYLLLQCTIRQETTNSITSCHINKSSTVFFSKITQLIQNVAYEVMIQRCVDQIALMCTHYTYQILQQLTIMNIP